jgi:hypothetical protein
MRVAPNFDAKALSLSGEDFSVLARGIVVGARAILASDDTIAVVENPEPIDGHGNVRPRQEGAPRQERTSRQERTWGLFFWGRIGDAPKFIVARPSDRLGK